MPTQTTTVQPETYLKHKGVTVHHTYVDDDVDQGENEYVFTVDADESEESDGPGPHKVFDARKLPAWEALESVKPPFKTNKKDAALDKAWDDYRAAEKRAVHATVVSAIEDGSLTGEGFTPPQPKLPPPGEPTTHKLPDGGTLEMMQEGVYINDKDGVEVTSWTITEWEDLDAVTATLNAISLALAHGAEAVRDRINKGA